MDPIIAESPLGVFPDLDVAIRYAFFAATAAWIFTNVAKRFLQKFGVGQGDTGFWWKWGVRALSVLLAALFGFVMTGTWWGVVIGGFSGVFNAFLFKYGKDRFFPGHDG